MKPFSCVTPFSHNIPPSNFFSGFQTSSENNANRLGQEFYEKRKHGNYECKVCLPQHWITDVCLQGWQTSLNSVYLWAGLVESDAVNRFRVPKGGEEEG